jgi:hypothetical protein
MSGNEFYMLRLLQRIASALMIVGAVNSASAFSMLGPYDAAYQVPGIGYNPFNGDIGGPMNLAEGYRWNIQIITYGFDPSFMHYFGAQGSNEVVKAITIFNNLPPVSKMSANLTEFPDDTRRENYQAEALNIADLKSFTLAFLMEQIGLASPERYVWTIRATRTVNGTTYYTVIKRNFDPVTQNPSSFVNDTLYTYGILSFVNPTFVDAVEFPVDPLAFGFTAVASGADGLFGGLLAPGEFYTGLTRDDVGGLRYLYSKNNFAIENPVPGTIAAGSAGGSSPWTPVGGTNVLTTNTIVTTALRPGVEKIVFKPVRYDSIFGSFITVTNTYTDTYITNSHKVTQKTQRVLTRPDILFAAGDLGVAPVGAPVPVLWARSGTGAWANNAALNTQPGSVGPTAGPGVIQPQAVITFSKLGPYLINATGNGISLLTEASPDAIGVIWGSFDGTTNAPIIYPNGVSIQQLEQQVLGQGNGGQ